MNLFGLLAFFFCSSPAWAASIGVPGRTASKDIACPKVADAGTPAAVVDVLKRVLDTAESLAQLRVQQQAQGSEIYVLMRIQVVSNIMIRSAETLSRSPNDAEAIETSLDELSMHSTLSAKIVDALIDGDATLAIDRIKDPNSVKFLQDLHCQMDALRINRELLGQRYR
ncbi:hypothetical protein [Dokdonella sp.]|uniref:hypothetical protein n=1 Tax=Dokdonella sp. TaxID=2291710 RepID=UPI003784F982